MSFYIHTDLHPIIVKDNIGWMVTGENNMLFKIDIHNNTSEFVTNLKDNEKKWRGYYVADIIDNYVICLPDRGDNVIIYIIDSGNQVIIELPHESDRWSFSSFVYIKNRMIAYSRTEKEFIQINLDTLTTTSVGKLNINEKIFSDFSYADKFYYVCGEKELILYEYCVKTEMLKCMTICKNDGNYRMASFDGDNFWFSGMNKRILVWNKSRGVVKEISLKKYEILTYNFAPEETGARITSDENLFDRKLFMSHYMIGDNIFFIPFASSHIVFINKIDMESNIVRIDNEVETIDTLCQRGDLEMYKYGVEYINDLQQLVIFSYKNNIDYCIDTRTGTLLDWRGNLEVVNANKYFDSLTKEEVSKESSMFRLNTFISFLKNEY